MGTFDGPSGPALTRRSWHVGRERLLPLDLGHRFVGVAVDFAVMHLQALLRGERRFAHGVLAMERFYAQMNEHVLLQVGLLGKVFVTPGANVLLLTMVDFLYVSVECILGAEDHFALGTMQLLGPLVHLLDMLLERLGVQVHLSALVARFLQRLLRGVNPTLVFHEAVVRFEPFQAMTAKKRQRPVNFLTMLNNILGTYEFRVAIGAVVYSVLRIALEREVVPQGNMHSIVHNRIKLSVN